MIRSYYRNISCSVGALLLFIPFTYLGEKYPRPNIIFLLTDDQSTYSIGAYGNRDVKTPNMDLLAADGVLFENHYVTTPICKASRASIMTGLYEYRTGVNFGRGDMPSEMWQNSYTMNLKKSGYLTAFAGKFGFEVLDDKGVAGLPVKDFDLWGGSPGKKTYYETARNKSMTSYAKKYPHVTLAYGAFGRDVIKTAAREKKPFLLSISFKAPHRPTAPDRRFDGVYKGKVFKKPENFGRESGEHFAPQTKVDRQYERFFSWNYADRYDEVMAVYHQQVYGVDVALGMIRDQLKKSKLDKNTVIIFTSDNGFFCGSHGYGSKVLPYEEASRCPLIIYDPRNKNSGKKIRHRGLTGNLDFSPTILALAGISTDFEMDGRDLMTLYNNPGAPGHQSLSLINTYLSPSMHAMATVTKDYKYIYWGYQGDGMKESEELYDLGKDPGELKNIASNPERKPILDHLRKLYDKGVKHWRETARPVWNYDKYADIMDRHVSWDEKKDLYGNGLTRSPKSSAKKK